MSRNALAHIDLVGLVIALAAGVLLEHYGFGTSATGSFLGAVAFLLSFLMQTGPILINGLSMWLLWVMSLTAGLLVLFGMLEGMTA